MNNNYCKPYYNKADWWWRSEKETRHHMIPTSRNWPDIEENKEKLYQTIHDALHRLFGNGTPVENLRRLWEIQSKVFSEAFKKELFHMLSSDDQWYYERWVWRK